MAGFFYRLDELYNTPAFLEIDRVELLTRLIEPEYHAFINRRYTSRLKFAHLSGCPQELSSCVDSADRVYVPEGGVKTLSTGNYIRNGMNICILGASNSGKTYLSKAMGIAACTDFTVEYYCTEELIEQLSDIKEQDLAKYKDYSNSSKSSSMSPNHKTIHNSREKSGRRPGGQPGHMHHGRKRQEPTETREIPAPDKYLEDPDFRPTGRIVRKQLVKVHVVTEVI